MLITLFDLTEWKWAHLITGQRPSPAIDAALHSRTGACFSQWWRARIRPPWNLAKVNNYLNAIWWRCWRRASSRSAGSIKTQGLVQMAGSRSLLRTPSHRLAFRHGEGFHFHLLLHLAGNSRVDAPPANRQRGIHSAQISTAFGDPRWPISKNGDPRCPARQPIATRPNRGWSAFLRA